MNTLPTTHIGTFERPYGILTILNSHNDSNEHASQRMAVEHSGDISGIPGFVREGAMAPEQVDWYLARILGPHSSNSGFPMHRQRVDAYLSGDGTAGQEIVATALWGVSNTSSGIASARVGSRVAHTTIFDVAPHTARGREFSPDEMNDIGLTLGYSLLRAVQPNFDLVTYNLELISEKRLFPFLDSIGLLEHVEPRDESPHFSVHVEKPDAMSRKEYGIPPEIAATGLERAYTWLAPGLVKEPIAS